MACRPSYNGGILDTPTPRIDKLAAEGLRLTNFNVENQCTPSRAALMTGRLPIRSGIGKAIAAGAPGGLHPWEITIAEMLGDAGYRTAMFGKWHLGAGEGRLPTDQGFDEWFGFETTDIIYWTGNRGMPLRDVHYIREARKGETPRNVQVYDEDTRRQIDRMVTDRAVDYIAKNGSGDRPFFLYVPFAFAHHPVLAHPDFKGKSPAGEFGDSLLEHDHNVGRILDALDGRRYCRQHRCCLGERQRPVTAPDSHTVVDNRRRRSVARRDRHSAGRKYPHPLHHPMAGQNPRRAGQQPDRRDP